MSLEDLTRGALTPGVDLRQVALTQVVVWKMVGERVVKFLVALEDWTLVDREVRPVASQSSQEALEASTMVEAEWEEMSSSEVSCTCCSQIAWCEHRCDNRESV